MTFEDYCEFYSIFFSNLTLNVVYMLFMSEILQNLAFSLVNIQGLTYIVKIATIIVRTIIFKLRTDWSFEIKH